MSTYLWHAMSRFAAFEVSQVIELLDENQKALVERGYRWCIVDKDFRRVCSLHLRQEIADRRALSLESTRTRKSRRRIA